jgi:hypothetical protein
MGKVDLMERIEEEGVRSWFGIADEYIIRADRNSGTKRTAGTRTSGDTSFLNLGHLPR